MTYRRIPVEGQFDDRTDSSPFAPPGIQQSSDFGNLSGLSFLRGPQSRNDA
jgi:hypothetical protein